MLVGDISCVSLSPWGDYKVEGIVLEGNGTAYIAPAAHIPIPLALNGLCAYYVSLSILEVN